MSLTMDTAANDGPLPATRMVRGHFVFSERIPADDRLAAGSRKSLIGRSSVPLEPFFGGPFARDVSTTTFGLNHEDFLKELVGSAVRDDSVEVDLIPRMSHGGISFQGSLRADKVRGRWVQKAYCCGARGSFVMTRVPSSTVSDSLIAQAVRATEKADRENERAEQARVRRIGFVRFRVLDESSGRYVPIGFAAESDSTNVDGGSVSFRHAAGEGGWGPAHEFEPGKYRFVIHDYPCADRVESPNSAYLARLPVLRAVVKSGATTDLEMRVNLDSLRRGDPRPPRKQCWTGRIGPY